MDFFRGVGNMEAGKQLIERAELDANTVAALHVIFDDVSRLVDSRFAGHPARMRVPITVANAVLDLATAGERDPAALGSAALTRVLALLMPED